MKDLIPNMFKIVVVFLTGFLFNFNIYATWSIIAVDLETGEIGMAGASCTRNVKGIGEYVPGKGIVVVQAMSNSDARELGIKMMQEGANPKEIISAMRNNQYEPEKQQYGVILINNIPETYSGNLITDWNGAITGNNFAVLGNILVGEKVVKGAFNAFNAAKGKHLSERLFLALTAGANEGGDKRCCEQHATSAFITVYKPDDDINDPYLDLYVTEIDRGGESAVLLLSKEYEQWKKYYIDNQSTKIKVIPKKEPLLCEGGKMKVTDFNLISFNDGTTMHVNTYAEAPEKGLISRDKFVDLTSDVKLYILNKIFTELGLTQSDYRITRFNEVSSNGVAEIKIICIMDANGLNIETTSDNKTENLTFSWDDL
jgi:uncharacterized Ntn-hydrolase superfamily protein